MKLIPWFFILSLVGAVSSCQAAHALSISESQQEYDERVDYESILKEACIAFGCPSLGFHIDNIKMDGSRIAAVRLSTRIYF